MGGLKSVTIKRNNFTETFKLHGLLPLQCLFHLLSILSFNHTNYTVQHCHLQIFLPMLVCHRSVTCCTYHSSEPWRITIEEKRSLGYDTHSFVWIVRVYKPDGQVFAFRNEEMKWNKITTFKSQRSAENKLSSSTLTKPAECPAMVKWQNTVQSGELWSSDYLFVWIH